MSRPKIENLYDTTVRLLRREAYGNLKNLLQKIHSSDASNLIDQFSITKQDILIGLIDDDQKLANIFSELGSVFLKEYLNRHENYDFIGRILKELPSDELADLLAELSEEQSKELLIRMEKKKSKQVSDLLQYQEYTAGALMSTEVLKIPQEITVREAIEVLQEAKEAVTIFYLYVVDEFDNLSGVLSVRQLFQFDQNTLVKEMMLKDVVRVHVDEAQEEVARIVSQYDLVAIPVIDHNSKLVGVITVDDVIDVIQEEAAENVLKLGNAEIEAIDDYSFLGSIKKRLPWVFLLAISGLISLELINYYIVELGFSKLSYLIGIIPLLLRIPSNIARRSSSIILQALGYDNSSPKIIRKIFWQQIPVTFTLATFASTVLYLYLFYRFENLTSVSLIASITLFSSMILAIVLGIFIPVLVHRFQKDFAWRMGSFINAIIDIFSILLYFGLLILVI